MPIDTSMYQVQPAPQPNLLGMMGQAASIQNAMNQNQLFQQTNRARLAVGKIMQDSVDPQTGQPDYDKAAISLSQHPDTALIAPELIKTWAGLKNLNLDNTIKSLDIARQRAGDIADVVGGTLARAHEGKSYTDKNGNGVVDALSQEDLFRAVNHSSLIAHNIPTEMKMQLLTKFGYPDDPRKPRDYDPRKGFQDAVQFGLAKAGAEKTMTGVFNNLKEIDQGGVKSIQQVNPTQSSMRPLAGGTFAQQPTPAERNAPVEVMTPQGAVRTVPRQQAGPMVSGAGTPAVGAAGGGPPMQGGGTPDATAVPTTSVTRASPGGVPTPQPAAAAVPTEPPGWLKSMNPVQAEQLKHVAPYIKEVNDEASAAVRTRQVIDEMDAARKGIKLGAGYTGYVKVAETLQAFGVHNKVVDAVAGGDLSKAQEFSKLANQLAMAQLRAGLGANAGKITNLEVNNYTKNNPNWDTDPRATDKVFSFLRKLSTIATTRQQALSHVYSRWIDGKPLPEGMSDISQFEPWWNKRLLDTPGLISAEGAKAIGGGGGK